MPEAIVNTFLRTQPPSLPAASLAELNTVGVLRVQRARWPESPDRQANAFRSSGNPSRTWGGQESKSTECFRRETHASRFWREGAGRRTGRLGAIDSSYAVNTQPGGGQGPVAGRAEARGGGRLPPRAPCSYGLESFTEGPNPGLLVSFSKNGGRKTLNRTAWIWRRK